MQTDFDIAICGAGPVGLALAALLVKHSVKPSRIALIDAKTVDQSARDPRSIALSYGSRQILEGIGAWPVPSTQIEQIHVSRRGHFGRTLIDRSEYGLPALGYVTRYGELATALNRQAATSGIAPMRPVSVVGMEEDGDAVTIHLAHQPAVRARIAVQAEGGVFSEQAKKSTHRDYDQTAIVSHVRASAPIPHRAFERFTDEGPLALLPQDGGYALVWCMRPETAARISKLDDIQFLAALYSAFGSRLGNFLSATPRHSFPLGLNADALSSRRRVAIGNAAQTLHPVAGQGLNLGLRDAIVLARLLAKNAEPDALHAFMEQRRMDRSTTLHLTDLMARVFASTPGGTLPQTVLGYSLGLIDGFGPAKRLLAEQMMFGRRG
ncbi:MAG TPA: UbiH/UbiF/VisC/COQ6 family ubiquinone biosynthesis hydroxylase [Oxalicibacterium sp.]|nr:UbiH/UbiF/VisC/COQ6 family ubiquinone biosynthesis hydroxylase [Oxalicibacterium sp.]